MSKPSQTWVAIERYRFLYEADIAISRLQAEGILAVKRGDGLVGLLSPGYDKRTTGGIEVLVPSDSVAEARRILDPES